MASKYIFIILCFIIIINGVFAQEGTSSCFGAGSVAGAAIGGFLAAIILVVGSVFLRNLYWRSRKGKHLVFTTDPESVKDEFAFDNAGFRHAEGSNLPAWLSAGDAATLPVGQKAGVEPAKIKNNHERRSEEKIVRALEKAVTRDDMDMEALRPALSTRLVRLRARDFAGLGFAAGGGARDGVRVARVLRAGPAGLAGLAQGDIISSVRISLAGAVLEDAVAIFAHASPYELQLEVIPAACAGGLGGSPHAGTRVRDEARAVQVRHPLYGDKVARANSMGDVDMLDRSLRHQHFPNTPNASQTSGDHDHSKTKTGGIKKIITEKIITTTTLERAKGKDKKDISTLERDDKKVAKTRNSDVMGNVSKPERNKSRNSTPETQILHTEIDTTDKVEMIETQKRESQTDPGKKGMKFGIRVLPPNVPDDGLIKNYKSSENSVATIPKSNVTIEINETETAKIIPNVNVNVENETGKSKNLHLDEHDNLIEVKSKIDAPVVAKRREKSAPPVPNARNLSKSPEKVITDHSSTFVRDDLNSSGIRRDENGIPQEIPQYMMEAATYARNNRKSLPDLADNKILTKEEDFSVKNMKKSKGKAPAPPENDKNKSEFDFNMTLSTDLGSFLDSERMHSTLLHDSSIDKFFLNTSTPNAKKIAKSISGIHMDESVNFSQEDIDDIVSKPFERENDSLNNFYNDSKSNLSSNNDGNSVISLNQDSYTNNSDKGSTTIALNSSDVTIHSSPINDNIDDLSSDENERKAASLGDLSRFELRKKLMSKNHSKGTLERAQSMDISTDEVETTNNITPKKRKANSVVEATFYDEITDELLPDMVDSHRGGLMKSKEPRLSLNITKNSAMDGLHTFQNNRLRKGSDFGNLEDAISKGSNSSVSTVDTETRASLNDGLNKIHEESFEINENIEEKANKIKNRIDTPAKRIMDENLKVHYKLVSEFAKGNESPTSSKNILPKITPKNSFTKYDEKLSLNYDTNIPDDVKVSRHTLVNSLERPKSEMMKKLLAKNPALNVHIDQSIDTVDKPMETVNDVKITTSIPKNNAGSTSSYTSINQSDIVDVATKKIESSIKIEPVERKFDDYVSNIKIGSTNNSFKLKTDFEVEKDTENNIVTISTDSNSQPSSFITIDSENGNIPENFRKSIEIGGTKSHNNNLNTDISSKSIGNTISVNTYFKDDERVSTVENQPEKTVTVNVVEDGNGNKIISKTVQEVSNKYVAAESGTPVQVEQMTFGVLRNPTESERLSIETDQNTTIDNRILAQIKLQNPNLIFDTNSPSFARSETIILDTNMDEEDALKILDKWKNDANFKIDNDLSHMGVKIVKDLEKRRIESVDRDEVVRTRYTINTDVLNSEKKTAITGNNILEEVKNTNDKFYVEGYNRMEDKDEENSMESHDNDNSKIRHENENNHNYVTEIQVMTPRTEKNNKNKTKLYESKNYDFDEPNLLCELDKSLLYDFLANERYHTSRSSPKNITRPANFRAHSSESDDCVENAKHSDYDLPRNSQIKFRTATYESPKNATQNSEKRLSQIEILRSNFEKQKSSDALPWSSDKPVISAKPSNIPVKTPEKIRQITSPISKIPVFNSQKSLSQENLTEKSLSVSQTKSTSPKLLVNAAGISITSIKSSSKHPSGK